LKREFIKEERESNKIKRIDESSYRKASEIIIDNVQKESLKKVDKYAYIDFILIGDLEELKKLIK
jgi:hypothetical protein